MGLGLGSGSELGLGCLVEGARRVGAEARGEVGPRAEAHEGTRRADAWGSGSGFWAPSGFGLGLLGGIMCAGGLLAFGWQGGRLGFAAAERCAAVAGWY